MGEIQPLRETTPHFVIDENALPEQRSFLEGFETRILNDPRLYMDAWGKFAAVINPERQAHQGISEIYGDSLSYLSEIPEESAKRCKAQYDWYLYMFGKGNAAALLGFDEATNALIQNSSQVKSLQERLSRSRTVDERSADGIRSEIRRIRISLFIKRIIDAEGSLEEQGELPPAKQTNIAGGAA